MLLRPARATDLPAFAALMNRAFRGVGDAAGWNSEANLIDGDRTTPALLAADLAAKPHGHLLLAELPPSTIPQGSVWLEPLSTTTWYLGSLTIDPTLQNTGLGRTLLELAEQFAVDRGAQTIRMTVVNQRETLIAWYQRRGYHLTGEFQPFPYDDNRFGTPRRPDLTFVVLEKAVSQLPPATAESTNSKRYPAVQVPQTDPGRT